MEIESWTNSTSFTHHMNAKLCFLLTMVGCLWSLQTSMFKDAHASKTNGNHHMCAPVTSYINGMIWTYNVVKWMDKKSNWKQHRSMKKRRQKKDIIIIKIQIVRERDNVYINVLNIWCCSNSPHLLIHLHPTENTLFSERKKKCCLFFQSQGDLVCGHRSTSKANMIADEKHLKNAWKRPK